MNIVSLIGRLTKDPIVNYTQGGTSITKFGLAVDRKFKGNGSETADFLNIIAFGKTGEFIEKWFHKGDPIALTGRIQTGSYTKQDGTKVYTTDIIAENVEFTPKNAKHEETPAANNEGFVDVGDDLPAGLPF